MIIKTKEEVEKAYQTFNKLKSKEQTLNQFALFLSLSINSYWKYYNDCLLNVNNADCNYFINIHELVITKINANVESRHLYYSEKIATAWLKKNNPNLYNFDEKTQQQEEVKIDVVVQPFKINE